MKTPKCHQRNLEFILKPTKNHGSVLKQGVTIKTVLKRLFWHPCIYENWKYQRKEDEHRGHSCFRPGGPELRKQNHGRCQFSKHETGIWIKGTEARDMMRDDWNLGADASGERKNTRCFAV